MRMKIRKRADNNSGKTKRKKALERRLVFAGICCMLPAAAVPVSAFNHYQIDVEALKDLSQSDEFPLKITKKTVADGVGTGDMSAPDMLTLSIENSTGDLVEGLVVLIACYDEEGKAQMLASTGQLEAISLGSQKREISVLTFEDQNAEDGSTFQLNIPCNHSNFTGAQAIVAQYTASGEKVTNPAYEAWQETALGNPTHILD